MTAPIPTLVHAPVKRTASKSLHKRNESKESAIKKSMIETLKKEIDILKLEVKQSTYYKQKYRAMRKQHEELSKKYVESQSIRKQQEAMIEL